MRGKEAKILLREIVQTRVVECHVSRVRASKSQSSHLHFSLRVRTKYFWHALPAKKLKPKPNAHSTFGNDTHDHFDIAACVF